MASLDLSAAFNVININLLIQRLCIIGLPCDVVDLIKVWLNHRTFYVCVNGSNSILYDLLCGTTFLKTSSAFGAVNTVTKSVKNVEC